MSEQIIPNVVVSMPSQLFTLARKFQAASNGKIFIGKIDTDPTIPENQIQVYLENEDGTTVPVSQPLIINQAGYPVYNGQIAKFVTVQGHSMAVYDSYGAQQFYYPNVLKYDPDQLRAELASSGGSMLVGHGGRTLNEAIGSVANVSAYWCEGDLDWGAAIQRAIDSGADTLEFTALPDGGKYNHSNTVIFNSDVKGSGIVNYTGNGDAYFATKKITVSGVQFESAGNDTSLWNIKNTTGITFCNNASVSGGRYNILVNGVHSQFTVGGGASIKYARVDNIKIIQCKRSVIEYDAYIYGASEWGINVDTTEAAEPDQMHGTVISGQIWGNKSGGVRCVGVDKLGDKGDWLQHLVIGGHIDHNYSDDDPERESHGIYIRYAARPVIQADVIRGANGYGLNIDHSSLPVISNKAYWKNKKGDYYIGENTGGAVILPYVGDYNGVNKNPTDTTEYGRSLSIWGNARIGGGVLGFGDIGSIKQFLSGGGRGNLLVDINSPEDKERKFTVTNGSRTDTKLLVSGQIGCIVYNGSPGGSVNKKIAICDQAGVFVGYIPVYQ